MKIRFVLSHPASQLYGEVREAVIASDLARLGHDAQVYRVHARADERADRFRDTVPVLYFPANDPAATPHATVSSRLLEALSADPPDIVLFKGLGYQIVAEVLQRLESRKTRIGVIIGGNAVDSNLDRVDFVLAESAAQIDVIRKAAGRSLPCVTLAKFIDWDVADRHYTERQRALDLPYDIVNVGSFEPRKNQMALADLFGRYRIAFVGSGETHAAVTEAASGFDRVKLFGALRNSEALGVVAQSRLMVHASLWEGVPRVVFESLACGTPVVAHDFAIQERFEETRAVRLVAKGELLKVTEDVLADEAALRAMSEEGRAFARDRHGPQRLAQAAGQIIDMATGG